MEPMKHLVDHFRDDLGAPPQGEHAVIPEVVTQRPANVDEIKLMFPGFVGKRRDDTVISVTDDRIVIQVSSGHRQ